MEQTGYRRINRDLNDKELAKCISCGRVAEFKVTFEDSCGKLIVTLCDDCRQKRYEELNLQLRLNWPGIA